jgi:transcriptional regulator with XRE-family HTH domain
MEINAHLIAALRKKKSWSQEELATASGLSLRTIQRIESDGAASLQSRKGPGLSLRNGSRRIGNQGATTDDTL